MNEVRGAAGRKVAFAVRALGGMIGPAAFVLPDGRQVSPLHVAPWDESEAQGLPALLRGLRGEWPCVPFGHPRPADVTTSSDWRQLLDAAGPGTDPHGYAANHAWSWMLTDAGTVALGIDYPVGHTVRRIERSVRADPEAATLHFALRIEAREDCRLPLGLHFTFRLPEAVGAARLEVGQFAAGRTYPGTVEEDAALFAPDRVFGDLGRVPLRTGGIKDAASLPWDEPAEELLQLERLQGEASLVNLSEGYRARIAWDAAVFPSLLLWFSNRGRRARPWNGRHLALGMEPICSAFDLGPEVSSVPNPLSDAGVPTARAFRAGEVFETTYRLSVEPFRGPP